MGDEAGKNGRARLGSARWSGRARAKTVATRYRLDSGPPSFQKTWVDRVRDKKNRAVQRVLVCCRLATASKDTFFKLKKKENHAAIKRLRAIRKGVVQHTERILGLALLLLVWVQFARILTVCLASTRQSWASPHADSRTTRTVWRAPPTPAVAAAVTQNRSSVMAYRSWMQRRLLNRSRTLSR